MVSVPITTAGCRNMVFTVLQTVVCTVVLDLPILPSHISFRAVSIMLVSVCISVPLPFFLILLPLES